MLSVEQRALDLLGRTGHGLVATSMHALPVLASADHIVTEGRITLRMHRGSGYHTACSGTVVAYGADNLAAAGTGESRWSVQVVGMCESAQPTHEELRLLGPAPRTMDGEPFDPVHLRIAPHFATVHSVDGPLDPSAAAGQRASAAYRASAAHHASDGRRAGAAAN